MKKLMILGMTIFGLMFMACEKSSSSSSSSPAVAAIFTAEEQELYSNYIDNLVSENVDSISLKNKVINSSILEANYSIIKDIPDIDLVAGDVMKDVIEKKDDRYYELFYFNGKLQKDEELIVYSLKDLLYGYFYDEYEEVENFMRTLDNSGELKLLNLSSEYLIFQAWTINFGFEYNNSPICFNYEVTKDGYIAKYGDNEKLEAKTISELNSLVKEYLLNWEKSQI